MTFKDVSRRRITVAAAALTIAGVGVAWAFGGGTTMASATGKTRAATPAASASAVEAPVADGTSDAASTTAANGAQQAAVRARRALRRAIVADGSSVAAGGVAVDRSQIAATASASAGEQGSDDDAGEAADITLRIPQRVSVTLPTVSNIRLPRVESGSVQVGTLPSVQPGWTTTVDLGDPEPQVTLPKVSVGPVATVTMPGASID